MLALPCGIFGLRQRGMVDFAVRRQRQVREDDHRSGNHVIRQTFEHVGSQLPGQFLSYRQSERVVAIPREFRHLGGVSLGALAEGAHELWPRQQYIEPAIRHARRPADATVVAGCFSQ